MFKKFTSTLALISTLYGGCQDQKLEKVVSSSTNSNVTTHHIPKPPPQKEYCKTLPNLSLLDIQIVSQINNSSKINQKPKKVSTKDEVSLYAILKAKLDNKTIYFSEAIKPKFKGNKQTKNWNLPCDLLIEWFKVEPFRNSYAYVSKRNPIDYTETPWKEGWKVKADVHPTDLQDQFPDLETGLGVMRYKVSIKLNGKRVSSPGKKKLAGGGLSNKVHRVSFRPATGQATDYIFELFNTPYIWGSKPFQVDNQIGSDCADLPVYGRRRQGFKTNYTWSKGLLNNRRLIKKLPFGTSPKNGDLIYFRRHIAVFYQSASDNSLSMEDKVIHTLYGEPEITKIKYIGMPSAILRWKK